MLHSHCRCLKLDFALVDPQNILEITFLGYIMIHREARSGLILYFACLNTRSCRSS
jgi:hypothetical protein